MGEIVRSEWVVDPDNPELMIRRNQDSRDAEYWDRVSKGEMVSSTARMFETRRPSGDGGPGFPIFNPGKIDTQSFIQIFDNTASVSESLRPGKLKISDVWDPEDGGGGGNKPALQVGKLNIKDLFQNQEENNNIEKPKAQIGKLDPQQIFDSQQQQEDIRREVIKVGKLNTDNLFKCRPGDQHQETQADPHAHTPRKVGKLNLQENFYQHAGQESERRQSEPGSPPLRVGKLTNIDTLFQQSTAQQQQLQREEVRVGKLKLPEDFSNSEKNSPTEESGSTRPKVGKLRINPFEQQSEPQVENKSPVQVGKLRQDIFDSKLSERSSEGAKLYKPSVQPKKMKIDQVFPVNDANNNPETQREEPKVGKLVAAQQFLNKSEDKQIINNKSHSPGKIDTSKLFSKEEQNDVESRSPVPIGRIKSTVFEAKSEPEPDKPVLRGARKLNRANRISCLIDNLTTDQPASPEDASSPCERDENDLEVEEHFNLGKERLNQIQSMFSNSPGGNSSCAQSSPRPKAPAKDSMESPNLEIDELKSEGLVSTNLQRFCTGNTLGSASSSHIPARLMETNYVDRGHIEAVSQKFSGNQTASPEPTEVVRPRHVGKLKNADAFLQHKAESETEAGSQKKEIVRVGKLEADIFRAQEYAEQQAQADAASAASVKKVGKLKVENMFQKSEPDQRPKERVNVGKLKKKTFETSSQEESKSSREVGRLSGDWLANASASPDREHPDTLPSSRVGKLSEDRLKIGQDEADTCDMTATNLGPRVGKLSEDKLRIGQEDGVGEEGFSEAGIPSPRVGKLSEDRLKIGQEEQSEDASADSCHNGSVHKVGKLTENRFKIGQDDVVVSETDETTGHSSRVGKLSEDRFKIGQDDRDDLASSTSSAAGHQVRKLDETRYKMTSEVGESERCDDTHIVPSGTVSKSASAFLNPSPSFDETNQSSKAKKSRSGNLDSTMEMQKKYEEQLAASKKAKEKKSQSFRMTSKDDFSINTKSSVSKSSGKSLKRAETFVATSSETKRMETTSSMVSGGSAEDTEEARVSVQEAKAKFFQSMQQASANKGDKVTSAQRLGTSILPATGGQSKGKALFNRCAEKEVEMEAESQQKLLPGVDFQEIEDEFDRLHKEMMGEE